jgi:hypothetical protein
MSSRLPSTAGGILGSDAPNGRRPFPPRTDHTRRPSSPVLPHRPSLLDCRWSSCADAGGGLCVFLASCRHASDGFGAPVARSLLLLSTVADADANAEGKRTSHCKSRSCYSFCLYIMSSPISEGSSSFLQRRSDRLICLCFKIV